MLLNFCFSPLWKDFYLKWNHRIWYGECHACILRRIEFKSWETDFPLTPDLQKTKPYLSLFFFLINLFIYLFLATLGLCCCTRAFSSCGKWGPLFIAVCGPLTIAASVVAEHRLQTRRLSSCGSRAQLLRGMWDLPRPGLEPVYPALAGGFSTTAPPGKPPVICILNMKWSQRSSNILEKQRQVREQQLNI